MLIHSKNDVIIVVIHQSQHSVASQIWPISHIMLQDSTGRLSETILPSLLYELHLNAIYMHDNPRSGPITIQLLVLLRRPASLKYLGQLGSVANMFRRVYFITVESKLV